MPMNTRPTVGSSGGPSGCLNGHEESFTTVNTTTDARICRKCADSYHARARKFNPLPKVTNNDIDNH